jgi:hypothetical protein
MKYEVYCMRYGVWGRRYEVWGRRYVIVSSGEGGRSNLYHVTPVKITYRKFA